MCQFRCFVYVYLVYIKFTGLLCCYLLKEWGDHLAGTAPVGIEIYKGWLVAQIFPLRVVDVCNLLCKGLGIKSNRACYSWLLAIACAILMVAVALVLVIALALVCTFVVVAVALVLVIALALVCTLCVVAVSLRALLLLAAARNHYCSTE